MGKKTMDERIYRDEVMNRLQELDASRHGFVAAMFGRTDRYDDYIRCCWENYCTALQAARGIIMMDS